MAAVPARICLALTAIFLLSACNDWSTPSPQETDWESQGIVNGNDETGFPAVGALVIQVPGQGSTGSSCTGTLIDPQWVLTAAHCIEGIKGRAPSNAPPSDTFYLNFYIGDNANDKDNGRRIPASQIFVHPKYSSPGGARSNDIALFQLSEPVLDVTPIPIHRARLEGQLDAALFYVGFGVNDPEGGGGGHKRSIALTLFDLAPAIYVTRQQGGGVCFGDSGGPGLMDVAGEQQVIGVNSTIFGAEKCLHYSTQIRVDAHQTWIDFVMNNGRGCLDSPDLCQCDGVCGQNGVCDNAQCGQSECTLIRDCLEFCGSYTCSVLCFLRATPSASYLYTQMVRCAQDNCAGQGADCIEEHCHRQRLGCEQGIDAVSGNENCGKLHRCNAKCMNDDRECLDQCFYAATLDAQSSFENIEQCVQEQCDAGMGGDPTPEQVQDCAAETCREQLLECMPDENCRLTGGSCEDNLACIPARWVASYCLPTQKKDIGQACDPEQVSCIDGAVCFDDGEGYVCRETCATGNDCDASFPPCVPVRLAKLDLSIGLCQLECSDRDGDETCDRDDCAPDNPFVHPNATEICDIAGIDENCDGLINDTCPKPPAASEMKQAPEPKDEASPWACECLATTPSTGFELSLLFLFGFFTLGRPRRRAHLPIHSVLFSLGIFVGACSQSTSDLVSEPTVNFDAGFAPSLAAQHDAGIPSPPSIWALQQGMYTQGQSILLSNVIVTSPVADKGFFIADGSGKAFGGVFVSTETIDAFDIELEIGDVIHLTGLVAERAWENSESIDDAQTRTELILEREADLSQTSSTATPQVVDISRQDLGFLDSAEMYEGVLVHLHELVVTASRAGQGELVLSEFLPLDNLFLEYDLSWLSPGTRFENITGLIHFDTGEFKIAPRFPEDLMAATVGFGDCIPGDGYVVCKNRKSWPDAQAACASLGGRLVILASPEKNSAVSQMVAQWSDRAFWIALSDRWTEGRWRWTDGSTLSFDAWGRGEPNDWGNGEDCAQSNFRDTGKWNDGNCNGRQVYVCEFPNEGPRCTSDDDCAAGPGTCVNGACVPQ